MGNNQDPVTLHKYLYANVDPVNNVDPTGNFSMVSVMSAVNIASTLATVASTAVEVFSIASGESEFSAVDFGTNLLLNRLPVGLVNKLRKRFKQRTGKDIIITCSANSFVEGTLVHAKHGLVSIEEIEIGDYVLSFNEKTGGNEYQKVVHLIKGDNDYELMRIQLNNGEVIEATLKHPFYMDSEWKDAEDIIQHNNLFSLEKSSIVADISRVEINTSVYNLTVDSTHTYYVGSEGILVHNAGRDCIESVTGMGQFFKTQFGVGLQNASGNIGRQFQGQSVFKVTKKSGPLKKGYHYYLDNLHKDHLEVFDRNGQFKFVLNLDGSRNDSKTAAALGRSIKNLIK